MTKRQYMRCVLGVGVRGMENTKVREALDAVADQVSSVSVAVFFQPNAEPVKAYCPVADAELHFSGGPLDGLKLIGFSVWQRKNGDRNVTFPARQYLVNGARRSFSLLRPIADARAQDRLRDLVLDAYAEAEGAQSSHGDQDDDETSS